MRITLEIMVILVMAVLLSCEVLDIRGRGAISITTQPTGCEVYLDGESSGDTTPCVLADVIKGQNTTLRLLKGDYLDWTDTVKVSGVDTLYVDQTFTGSLIVSSIPEGASIILDGEATSKATPHTFDSLIAGPHSLRLEHEGAATLDSSIVISYGEQTEINVNLSEHYGYLQVQSTPTGAQIWLNGSNTGYTTNYLLENVGVGSHGLKLVKEGYVEWDTTVAVSENQTTTVVAILEEEEEPTGSIQINSTPTGAAIYLDDSSTAKTTNAFLEDISPGSHRVRLTKDSYIDWDTTVIVNTDQTTTVNAMLYQLGSLKWRYPIGAEISTSPAIGLDGTIYFGANDNYLYALNPDGSLKWRYACGTKVSSSPTIGSDGTIYFVAWDTYLYAFNPGGSLKWNYNTGGEVESSPAIGSDGTIYLGSGGYLYALNPDGTKKWCYRTGSTPFSPAIGSDGTIYTGAWNGYFYAFNPDSTLKWQYFTEGTGEWRIFTSPAIDADGTIYFGCEDSYYLYALNPNGTLKWYYKTEYYVTSSPVIDSDGTIYFGSWDDYLYALNPNGSLKWQYKTESDVTGSSAVGLDATIYVGSWDGSLYAFTQEGEVKWSYATWGGLPYSFAIGADGTIYFGSEDGYFYALRTESNGLADSPWPKFQHDNQNTGRYGGP